MATKKTSSKPSAASQQVAGYIAGTKDWRGKRLAELRKLIQSAAPELMEDWKWGVPVWAHDGLVCSIAAFNGYVKINFFRGALLKDPKKLFNNGLDSKAMRAIDFHEGDKIDEAGVRELIRAAVTLNEGGKKKE